jgi:hypothetical protein
MFLLHPKIQVVVRSGLITSHPVGAGACVPVPSQIQVVVLNVKRFDNKPILLELELCSCYIPNTGCRIECMV